MFNGSAYNADAFNGSGYTIADALTYSPDQPYILQLRNSSGTMLAKVEDFTDGSWKSQVNAVGTLTLTLPLDSTLVQSGDLAYPNRVWLYDSTLEPLQQFVIVKTTADHSGGTFEIEAATLLYLLTQEYVPYTFSPDINSVRSYIKSILDEQVATSPISLGYIHPSIGNLTPTIVIDRDKSMYDAIMTAWKQFGGIISMDSYGRIRWDKDTVGPGLYSMTLYDDIETYKETQNTDTVINRIYASGNIHEASETSHNRQILAAPGYVEDTTSQATYGIRPKRMSFNVSNQTELTQMANRVLAYLKDPQVIRDISAIDLARVQLDPDNPITPHPEYIYAGARIRVTPPSNIPNAATFDTTILTVDRSLTDFLGVTITVGDIDPRRTGASGSLGSSSEFFDELADIIQEFDEWDETFHEQDDDIWDFLDQLQTDFNTLETPENDVNEIQPVGSANALGSNTKFAPSDHAHRGVDFIYSASWGDSGDLPDDVSPGIWSDTDWNGMVRAWIDGDPETDADAGEWLWPPGGPWQRPRGYFA